MLIKVLILTMLVLVNTSLASTGKTTIEEAWGKTVKSGNEHTTTLQFYFHDIVGGKSPTAVQVAQPINSTSYPTGFGNLMMVDDPLTVGPDPKSNLVGRAQGLYGIACQDELSLIMALSYTFSDGPYKESSISIMGRNSVMHPIREMPVIGGTGLFRMARGYAVAQTYSFDMEAAIVGYNVTIVH